MTPNVTNAKRCSSDDGRLFAANNNRRVHIGQRTAILSHNSWVDLAEGEQHQIALDFASGPNTASGDATLDCENRIAAIFPEYVQQD
jgi:hypothetical protein